jgi:hypothetical protein
MMSDESECGRWAVDREERSQKAKRKSQNSKPGILALLTFAFCVLPFDLLFGSFLPHAHFSEAS